VDPITALLLLAGGLVAGFVNTVAGGGSVVTLPILMEVAGLPATVANGTNRIAILLQNVAGVSGYAKGGVLEPRRVLPVLPALLVGALAGAWGATQVSPEAMKKVFAGVIVLVALSVVVKPSRWLGGSEKSMAEPWRSLAFFGIGVYGGFVQAGVGFLLLAGLVLGSGFDLVRGNAAKVFLVLLYTPLTLLLFWQAGQVAWLIGLVLAAGNVSGALLASWLAVKKGAGWIRWVLVVAALAAAARMLFA
jgi:uncharacterized membrane protein YfcA